MAEDKVLEKKEEHLEKMLENHGRAVRQSWNGVYAMGMFAGSATSFFAVGGYYLFTSPDQFEPSHFLTLLPGGLALIYAVGKGLKYGSLSFGAAESIADLGEGIDDVLKHYEKGYEKKSHPRD